MIDFGALIIPAEIVSALADTNHKSGWLSGAVVKSEHVFVAISAQIGSETKVCNYYTALLPHRSWDVIQGVSKEHLLRWTQVEAGFIEEYPVYKSFNTVELAARISIDPAELVEATKYVCVVEVHTKGPKVHAFKILSKSGLSKCLRMDVITTPETSDPYVRIPQDLTAALRDKRVAVVGVGSGGGEIVLNLACAGVGHLLLFDDDRLHPENYIRHVLTKRDLGRTKIAGIVDALRERNLPTEVISEKWNVLLWADEFRASCAENRPDLIICATDSRNSRRFVNVCAIGLNIPLVVAGLLDAGRVGEIIFVQPRETACYECIRLELGSALEGPESGERSPTPYGGEENVPQSTVQRFDIGFVSSIATRVALQVLDPERYSRLPVDYLVWGRDRLKEYAPPFNFEYPLSLNLVRSRNALIAQCAVHDQPTWMESILMANSPTSSHNSITFQRKASPSITVSRSALRRIRELSENSDNVETGGILVGHELERNIEIIQASDAGPNADSSSSHFLRDTAHCRDFLARCYNDTGADYLGEWHSHVVALRRLSPGDLNTLIGILIDPDYDFVIFAVLLVVVGKKKMELLVYAAEHVTNEARREIRVSELYRGNFPDAPDLIV